MIQIDRTEIEAWGKKYDAKGNFPNLIAKLIRETTPKSTILQIPSGSAVNMGGWDGVVICREATGYVPLGISVWEIGTNATLTKANKDYKKRTENSQDFEKSERTYVFVTTDVWEGKTAWANKKKIEGIWGDVKAYDSRDIAEWLEYAQISCRWFSTLTQNHPYDGVYTAEEYWKMLSMGPKGQLPPKLLTTGRETQCKALLDFLSGEPALKAVQASTKEEAIAFIIASAMLFDNHPMELFFSRSVVVDNEHTFHGLRINKNSINLIAKLDVTGKLYVAVYDNKHHVLVPLGPDDSFPSKDIITLPRIDREGQIEALQEMGLSREDAYKYSKEAGRDYTILKNLLNFPTDESKWKVNDNISEIVPALLIGRWDETKEGDQKVLEKLSGESYNTYSEKLFKWLEVESPPIIKIGNSWRLTSPLNAWTYLSNHISSKDFENLRECFLLVMKEINPALKLEPNERQIPSFSNKESLYSAWCREGLTQSLILIGLHGDTLKFRLNLLAQDWVDKIIKELLFDASGNLWSSRNPEMPLIGEASPKSFFESAYHSMSLTDKPIMQMFQEEDTWLSATSRHTGLLWALEGLAWTEEYILDASILLARLATIDPGGKLANRPLNSLREIYKPWHYQTLASLDDRFKILEQIILNNYETGWSLLRGMISKGSESAVPTHKLRWRLFERSFETQYNWEEIFETHSRIIDLLIKYFDYSETRLIDLLEKSESEYIQQNNREKILSFIELNIEKIRVKDNSAWHKLRSILSLHRSSSDAPWALPEEVLNRYDNIYKKLQPDDLVERVIWMFNDYWPSFPEGLERKKLSSSEQEELVLLRRVEGLKSIHNEFGFEFVKELAKTVKDKQVYGDILASIIHEEREVISLCEYLKEDEKTIVNFIQRFIFRKSITNGIEWVFDLYHKLKKAEYSNNQLARVFYQVEQTRMVWEFISKTSTETQTSYWKDIYPRFRNDSEVDIIFCIDKLIEVKRFISALEIAYYGPEKLPTDKLLELLENAAIQDSEEDRQFEVFHVTRIIENLKTREGIEKSVLMNLEWLYLPFLTSHGCIHKPNYLHEELANNPDFFMEVVKCIWKSDKQEEDKEDISDESIGIRAKKAYDLLHYWNQIPGVDADGNINEMILAKWIDRVRYLADYSGHVEVTDNQIGHILAEYPEKREPWPPKEICKIIDSINTQSLKSGFSAATFNKRGFSSRGPFEGGNIERRHENYFRSQANNIKYNFPHTAEILNQLADGYAESAKRMDEMAERNKLDH